VEQNESSPVQKRVCGEPVLAQPPVQRTPHPRCTAIELGVSNWREENSKSKSQTNSNSKAANGSMTANRTREGETPAASKKLPFGLNCA